MTNGKTQEIQENSQIIEIGETNNLVLTQNGVVVGFVTVKRYYDDSVEFLGRAVNLLDYSNGVHTINGFSAGSSIRTDDVQEVATVQGFYDALTAYRNMTRLKDEMRQIYPSQCTCQCVNHKVEV